MNIGKKVSARHIQGFTLIELMVVLVIIAIFAAFAIPSYKRFITRGAESKAQVAIYNIANDLDNWKSSKLSYRGYEADYLDTSTKKLVAVPYGSSPVDYQITLTDSTGTSSLSAAGVNGGRYWRMKAEPNTSKYPYARKFYMDSVGNQCAFTNSTTVSLTTAKVCEISGSEEW